MKNQYAGDIGDFSKFGLLRNLQSEFPAERIGIVWYLTPDQLGEGLPKDGRFTSYPSLEKCDPELYQKLQAIARGIRRVSEFRRFGLMDNIGEYGRVLDGAAVERSDRPRARNEWFRGALGAMADRNLVFLDPDNGIGSDRTARTQVAADKYALPGELQELHRRGKTVVCYQHAIRANFDQSLREKVVHFPGAFPIRWRRLQARAYIVWPSEGSEQRFRVWEREIVTSVRWAGHFAPVPSSSD